MNGTDDLNGTRIWKQFSTILLLVVLSGCKEETFVSSVPIESPLTYISGRIDHWTMGDTMTAVFGSWLNMYGRGDSLYVFGASRIEVDGSFLIVLSTPPSEILRGIANGAFHFSDPSAQFVFLLGLLLRYPNGAYYHKYLYNSTIPYTYAQPIGDYRASFAYADRDVNIVGTDKGWSTDTIIVYHNLHYKEGRNRIVNRAVAKEPHTTFEESVIENVNEGNWYLQ